MVVGFVTKPLVVVPIVGVDGVVLDATVLDCVVVSHSHSQQGQGSLETTTKWLPAGHFLGFPSSSSHVSWAQYVVVELLDVTVVLPVDGVSEVVGDSVVVVPSVIICVAVEICSLVDDFAEVVDSGGVTVVAVVDSLPPEELPAVVEG